MKNYELQAFLQFDDGSSGNAAANQSFNVTIARNGSGDATIYQDAAGTIEFTRPFSTDQYGRFKFYAPNGYYNILFDDPDVANLNNLLDRDIFAVEAATTEQSGLVELATQTEMNNGTANVVPTADVVKTYVDAQSGSGEANTTSNSGAGAGLALPKVGVDLPFKSLIGGSNVTITEQAETVTISSAASGGATNLGYTASPTNGVVTSDTGTDATIPAADATNAGLLLPAEKTKLSGIGVGAQLVSVQAGTNVTVDNTDPQNPIVNATGGGGGGFGTAPYVIDSTGLPNGALLTPYIGMRANNNVQVQMMLPIERDNAPLSVTVDSLVDAQVITYDGGVSTWNVTGVSIVAAQSTSKIAYLSLTLGTQAGGVNGQNTAGWGLRTGTAGNHDIRFTINYA